MKRPNNITRTLKNSLMILFLVLLSCTSKQEANTFELQTKQVLNTFEPQTKAGKTVFNKDDFRRITQQQIESNDFWVSMNHADIDVGVFKTKNGLQFNNPQTDNPYYFDLGDGKLEISNHGEFGGEFNFIPLDKTKDTVRILDINIICVFRFNNEIYFLTGIAHMIDQGGALVKLIRDGDKFRIEEVLDLESSPEAMAIYQDKILIAGHQNFTVIHDFKKEFTIENAFWSSLYPNSIVVLNDDEVYVGMRGGYARVSLSAKKIEYYRHRSIL